MCNACLLTCLLACFNKDSGMGWDGMAWHGMGGGDGLFDGKLDRD